MAKGRISADLHWREAKDHLDDMQDRARDFKPVFLKAEKELNDAYVKNFTSNGSLVGGWAPLDRQYGSWKSSNFPGRPTLVRSGRLFRSIQSFPVRKIGKKSATFGTDVPVAKFHQYGTWSMPERRIIFEPPMFAKKLAKDVAKHVKG
jgi:phage gpG-like protein